jgi:peptidyl-prolyl cis-trans isomerase C
LRRILCLSLLLLVWGCSGETPDETATTEPAAAPAGGDDDAAVAPVPEVLPDVVARVNAYEVSDAELERAIESLEARAGGPVPPEQRDRIYRDVLEQIIGFQLLVQEGEARNMSPSEADVESRVSQVRAQFPTPGDFDRMLEERAITVEDVRADARRDAIVQRLLESEMASRVSVEAQDVDAFYHDNPDQFQQGEAVRASHILVTVAAGADDAAREAARTKAADLLTRIRGGADFATLAREHSNDPGSAANGGDLGFFQQGQMVGPFNDAAFSLAPGVVSDLVETDYGYHIIKVAEKQPGRAIPLDEVRPQVEQFLQQRERDTQTEAFIDELRAKGAVQVLL